VPSSREEVLARAEDALRSATTRHRLLAFTGASNVTGELWPLAELVEIAHRHGARVAVDAAQLAPHRPIDIAALGIDYLALSAHKLYAPFGAGVLVGRADWLDAAEPYLAGGGAVRRVTIEDTNWADGFARHEAGTPNVLGAVALAAACRTLSTVGMSELAEHEATLLRRATRGLDGIPGVKILSMWGPASPRVGIVAFRVHGWHPGALAAALSAEHGVGVRDGAFCAHPLVASLAPDTPGAVRASFGAGTTKADIDRFVGALEQLVRHGARWPYRVVAGRHVPDPDPRRRPQFVGSGATELQHGRFLTTAEPCRSLA
jgi:selenocysteine lyase/cysteine desulfurase